MSNLLSPKSLVRFCQGAIINLRPTSLNICTGYLPFCGSNCEQHGAVILHNWLPCAIQSCGTQALTVPFCYLGTGRKSYVPYYICKNLFSVIHPINRSGRLAGERIILGWIFLFPFFGDSFQCT